MLCFASPLSLGGFCAIPINLSEIAQPAKRQLSDLNDATLAHVKACNPVRLKPANHIVAINHLTQGPACLSDHDEFQTRHKFDAE